MKLAFTVKQEKLFPVMDERFARTEKFLIYDTDGSRGFKEISNKEARESQQGAGVHAASLMIEQGIDCVITGTCGPKARKALEAAGITIHLTAKKSPAEALKEALSQCQADQYE